MLIVLRLLRLLLLAASADNLATDLGAVGDSFMEDIETIASQVPYMAMTGCVPPRRVASLCADIGC